VGSADLQYTGSLYYRGLSLPFGEFRSLIPVRIYPGKALPVLIKHSDLPVLVLAPSIFPELRAFSSGFGFGHGLNISTTVRTRKYQFGQYFARKQIILHYRVGSTDQRKCTTCRAQGQAIRIARGGSGQFQTKVSRQNHKEDVRAPYYPGQAPECERVHIYTRLRSCHSKRVTCSHQMGLLCPQNLNEHDHKFGILLSFTGASNQYGR